MTSSPPPTPALHHLESSQSLRILWALEELNALYGTEYKLVRYPRVVPNKALLEVNPLGFSPVLTLPRDPSFPDSKDNRIIKIESRLILNYLLDTYDRDGVFSPAASDDEERDEFFSEFGQNTVNQRIGLVLAFELIPQSIPWWLLPIKLMFWATYLPIVYFFKTSVTPRIFQYLEDALTAEKPWFSGVKLGRADILMAFPVDMAVHRGDLDGLKYPKLKQWHGTIVARPAYQRALNKGGKYDLTFR